MSLYPPKALTIVGSRTLEVVPAKLVHWMHRFPAPRLVMLRRPLKAPPARFERMVAHVAEWLAIDVIWMSPKPGGGRKATFERDIEMVSLSDCVLAFFAGEEMSGGTEHVVEKAIDQRVPVYSFGVVDDRLVWLGSHDPDDVWGRFTI